MASRKFDSYNRLYEQMYGAQIGEAKYSSGFSVESRRRPLSRVHHGKKTLWAVTMAQMYLRALQSGEVPEYPSEESFGAKPRWMILGGNVDKRKEGS